VLSTEEVAVQEQLLDELRRTLADRSSNQARQ